MNQQDIERHIASEVRRLQDLRRTADQHTATLIQSSRASIFSPLRKQEVETTTVPDAQSDVVNTHAGPSTTPFWSHPIPDPDIPPAYTDRVEKAIMTHDVNTPTTNALVPATNQASASPTRDLHLGSPELEQLMDSIQSLQRNMATMTVQHTDLLASLDKSNALPQGHTTVYTVPVTAPEEAQEAETVSLSIRGVPSGEPVPRLTNALSDYIEAYSADTGDEVIEMVSRLISEFQEQHDAAMAENEALQAENRRLMDENLGLISTAMEISKVMDTLMDEKTALEEVLVERDGQLAKQKNKYQNAKRIMTLARDAAMGIDDPSSQELVTDGVRLSLIEEASEQLRETVGVCKEQHSILCAEISSLEDKKEQLLLDVDMFSLHSVRVPSISSRPSGACAYGEREF